MGQIKSQLTSVFIPGYSDEEYMEGYQGISERAEELVQGYLAESIVASRNRPGLLTPSL